MTINRKQEAGELELCLSGRLDTTTAPALEEELRQSLTDDTTKLVFDFSDLAYISSAGLRVLLTAQKIMNKKGSMVVRHVSPDVMDVFDVTGFSDILTIEKA